MKDVLVGKNKKGFSTLELMIAFAILSIALVGSVTVSFTSQYWMMTSRTANEALYKAKTKLEDMRALIKEDFYNAVSSPLTVSNDPADPVDASCIAGGLCYYVQSTVTDISSCSKYVDVKVQWQIVGYPLTDTSLFTNLTNSPEIISKGGDCLLNVPAGNWKNNSPQSVGVLNSNPGKQYTGIDVLHKKIYASVNTIPSFVTYSAPAGVGSNPIQVGSLDVKVTGASVKLNSLDVDEDLSTGRTYAFAVANSNTKQLVVIDVTDATNPSIISQITLQNVNSAGSYPEGWRTYVYGGRLYVVVRETDGTEFHVFDISTPTIASEIGNGFELNKTVEDFIVRDQKVGNIVHRFAFLATDSNSKEFTVLDVTADSVSEIKTVDLPGDYDGYSLFVLGKKLYFGRASNPTGPELFVFDVTNPAASLPIIGQGEVGADVTNIKISSDYAYIGTKKNGEEIQIWNSDYTSWNPLVLNSGRFKTFSFTNLSPLGFDIDGDWIYGVSNLAGNDKLQVLHTTP